MQTWQNRITRLEYHKPSALADHPHQWRAHTESQAAAIKGILEEVGIAGALLAYYSAENDGQLTAIDGHMRKSLAPNVEWPVLVLDVDDDEARKLLATFDPIGAMAQIDTDALLDLLKETEVESQALTVLMEGIALEAESSVSQRPQFDDLIEQFTSTQGRKIAGDEKWFYVEFYGDPQRWEALNRLLHSVIDKSSGHELDNDFFYRMVNAYFSDAG